MKMFLYGWVLPLGAVWAWYLLSYNDISFGLTFLTRDAHDFVFMIYGHMLGMPASEVPILFLKAFLLDTLLVIAFMAYRRRAKIKAYFAERRVNHIAGAQLDQLDQLELEAQS